MAVPINTTGTVKRKCAALKRTYRNIHVNRKPRWVNGGNPSGNHNSGGNTMSPRAWQFQVRLPSAASLASINAEYNRTGIQW